MSESPCAPVQDGCRTTLQVEKSLTWNTSFTSHTWPLSRSAKPLLHYTLGSVICTHSITHSLITHILLPTGEQRFFTPSLVTYWLEKRSASFFRVKEPMWFDPEEEGTTLLENVGNYLPVDKGQQPGRLESSPQQNDAHNPARWTGKEWNRNLVKESPGNYITSQG